MGKISASLMCADLLNLERDITRLEGLGVEYLHLDFMDGQFVSNITFGTGFVRACRRAVKTMALDIHIMGFVPEQYFEKMEIGPGDLVSFHYEACENQHEVIRLIRERGASPLLAISPDTPVDVLREFADEIDGVLIMTVYPGDSGRPLVPGSFEKLAATRALLDECGYPEKPVEVDGCVSWVNTPHMRDAGTELYVVGSSSVFEKGSTYEETVPRFRAIIG